MVHAKAVVIDDELALAGSANLDARSLFLNYELMVAFYEPADVAPLRRLDRRRARARRALSGAASRGWCATSPKACVLWLAFQL